MFGSRVILNGQVLGDHRPSFTPGYFNAKPALKVGENELLIRVGADRDAVGQGIPSDLISRNSGTFPASSIRWS